MKRPLTRCIFQAVYVALALCWISPAVLAQTSCAPEPSPIYLSVEVAPQGGMVGVGEPATLYLTAIDIDTCSDPWNCRDNLTFSGWPGPTPQKGTDGVYRATCILSFAQAGDQTYTITADDINSACEADDTPADVTVTIHVSDHPGLPTQNLNDCSNRCNFRWAGNDLNKVYGDDFVLSADASSSWVVDSIRVWAVPVIAVAPDQPSPQYNLGDHFGAITLYGGPDGGTLSEKAAGVFQQNSSTVGNVTPAGVTITAVPVTYVQGQYYRRADGQYDQIWQIDFSNLNWSVTGGTKYVFGVRAVPNVDRLWFLHAVNVPLSGVTQPGADGKIRRFDVSNLSAPIDTVDLNPQVDILGWFGRGSDISVQVFAHPE